MNSSEVEKLHDDYIAAWRRDDREAAMSFWSDDIVMRAAGSVSIGGKSQKNAGIKSPPNIA